ncbi:MAG: FAD-dependent oxidoreductase [Candidatus Limiplasma sp.]|nr:FAD-dependent oxidoreductase [Clostridiales bacterium]MDY3243496.1 FAD-dependent oxidoreductase [Candidatus Limiplasma sp.]MDY4061699.1 FAD-dependent oxidoreductase [Candidatus Limiplasma sp.]
MEKVDVLVVGAGPAGMAAAIAAKEAGVDNILVLEREANMGGILRQCIHNGFGLHRFKEELTGPEYAQRDIDKVKELGIEVRCGTTVLSIDENRFVTAVSKEKGIQLFEAGALILAMGCRERPRGALATPGTRCAGIYSAGTAQKFVNLEGYMPGKRVVILGSGDIGLIMARRMTLQGAKVLACVELMPYSSGLNRNIVQCLHDYDIPLLLSHTVIDIQGKERLTGVTVAEVDAKRQPIPGTEQHFDCDTLLLSVGLLPENELTRQADVEMSNLTSGAVVDDTLQTSKEGIFACGNVLHVHDLVDFVSAESFKAGKAAAEYVRGKKRVGTYVSVKDGDGVRGVVPQKLLIPDGDAENVQIMFRPSGVYENAYIRVMDGEKELIKQKKRILTPGEMAELILKPEVVKGLSGADVTVSIVKE